ncbi:ATP-binding cassette domain-containing protein [Bryobacter aggregatus]|uniref:ATP-binding cassette domain-containing protein n=1 Tax=Bryobacter aggregatus TaxID=360054 RepID=UPI00068B1B1F|nr:ATP-binding cassette domain-containing protein [Bryobacter aggregatus]
MSRRWFVPEVIQSSSMDCGPASLKALFGGYHRYLSYGRLREACQTDVDGTSIDTMEETAQRLGMEVTQMMMPPDLLLLPESACLPAIVVTRLAGGSTHFVVLWRVHGPYVQLMDPSVGRLWMKREHFLASLFLHEQAIPREAWLGWAESETYQKTLARRCRALGVPQPQWEDLAALDAALRLTEALVAERKIAHREVAATLAALRQEPGEIPDRYWSICPVEGDESQVRLRGAVLLQAAGCGEADITALPEALRLSLTEAPPQPGLHLWRTLREAGWAIAALLLLALFAAAAGTVVEALLFRSLFDLAKHLTLSGQRIAALGLVAGFLCGLLLLEWPAELSLLRLGRQLESRLRMQFLSKIPLLGDRYFQSRLVSDMAYRAHSIQMLRQLPELAAQLAKLVFALGFTVLGIGYFFPQAWLPAGLAAIAAVGVPLFCQAGMQERDMRVRELTGSLSRFYLDALLGVTAIQAHAAEGTLRRAQARQLAQWSRAGIRQLRFLVQAEALQLWSVFSLVIWLLWTQASAASEPAGLLLLVYWALAIPALGQQIANLARNYPELRNTMLRFLEPLGSPEEVVTAPEAGECKTTGVAIELEEVRVAAAGHPILNGVSLQVAPGEQVAVVGLSGAGKSSLVGLLLGWHQPVAGRVLVDGEVLDAKRLSRLRRETAWIDPQVQLFEDSLFANLSYGNDASAGERIGRSVEDAELSSVLQRLPEGLQTRLGEGGRLVSGGEGQRVRMGRAMARDGVRLAILDEPARGLDRRQRQDFVGRVRNRFPQATMFCITHDVVDTMAFSRVLVMEEGRILEDGNPRVLFEQAGSRYRALYDQEEMLRRHLWNHKMWRRLRLEKGRLQEEGAKQWSHV